MNSPRHAVAAPPRPSKHRLGTIQTRISVLTVGVFILLMLVLIPVWNAVVLLDDAVFTHFAGRSTPHQIIAASFATLALYLLTLPIFFRMSPAEVQTEFMLMFIGMLFIGLLGFLFLLISLPEKFQEASGLAPGGYCKHADNSIFSIFVTSQALQVLRATASCKDLSTVEHCEGYVGNTKEIELLRDMEDRLQCSGFCYTLDTNATKKAWARVNARLVAADPDARIIPLATTALLTPPAPSLVEINAAANSTFGRGGKWVSHRVASLASSSSAGTSNVLQSAVAELSGASRKSARGVTVPFPPTLFSRAQYQASCDGQAFRHVQAYKSDVSSALFMEGMSLLCATVGMGFLLLAGKCGVSSPRRYQRGAQGN